jgi:hypothetical protein
LFGFSSPPYSGDVFSFSVARQLISDGHPGAAVSAPHNEIAVVEFILHRLAAGIHRGVSASNGPTKVGRGNHDLLRTLLPSVSQLRNQLVSEMIN